MSEEKDVKMTLLTKMFEKRRSTYQPKKIKIMGVEEDIGEENQDGFIKDNNFCEQITENISKGIARNLSIDFDSKNLHLGGDVLPISNIIAHIQPISPIEVFYNFAGIKKGDMCGQIFAGSVKHYWNGGDRDVPRALLKVNNKNNGRNFIFELSSFNISLATSFKNKKIIIEIWYYKGCRYLYIRPTYDSSNVIFYDGT